MRLSQKEVEILITTLTPFLDTAELRLYGSRVRDDLKGGDIDLLLLVPIETSAQSLREKKHVLLAAIKSELGDQKIDLTIATPEATETDNFLRLIKSKSVLLHRWT